MRQARITARVVIKNYICLPTSMTQVLDGQVSRKRLLVQSAQEKIESYLLSERSATAATVGHI